MTLASVIIPYKNREENLKVTLEHLADQTINSKDYEIIIGSLDEEETLRHIVSKYDNIKVISQKIGYWNPSYARNLGFQCASGKQIILIDADIIVPADFVQKHLDIASLTKLCVGSVSDYNEDKDTDGYLDTKSEDIRWTIEPNIAPLKWALTWTGNLSFNRQYIDRGIIFDEEFEGWGGEDLDWAYRIQKEGAEIEFFKDIYGKHIPHQRDVKRNREEERKNFNRFLIKTQDPEVEFVVRFGDMLANKNFYSDYDRKLEDYCLLVSADKSEVLVVGKKKNEKLNGFDNYYRLNLSGIALPFENKSFSKVIMEEMNIDKSLKSLIVEECNRVRK